LVSLLNAPRGPRGEPRRTERGPNLLVVLRALLSERHVTRAAARVGLSQSATSHALARLRELYADPLLVRSGKRLELTPRAADLLPELERGWRACRPRCKVSPHSIPVPRGGASASPWRTTVRHAGPGQLAIGIARTTCGNHEIG
jgi:hypothetical protein